MKPETFSLLDPAIQACPYAAYAALHKDAPVYHMPETGHYLVSRYDDILKVVSDPATYSDDWKAHLSLIKHESAQRIYETQGLMAHNEKPFISDPPATTRYRKVVERSFSPGRIAKGDPAVRKVIAKLIDGFAGKDAVEFVREFCQPLPTTVIVDRLGLPEADTPFLKEASDAWFEPFSMMLTEEQEIRVATLESKLQHYLATHIEARQREPREDILTDIALADYDDTRPLTIVERVGIALVTLGGGNATTMDALGMAMKLLIEHPGLEGRLRGNPTAIKNFVEESLRLESPTQGLFRWVVKETELGGVTIPVGSVVVIQFGAANRDEAHFPKAGLLDVDRRNANTHLAFSQAYHSCIGAPLARQEMQLSFDMLLDRFENFRFADVGKGLEYAPGFVNRGLKQLLISFDKR